MSDLQNLNHYEQTLLDGWEDVYKKSQLNLWLLLSLREGDKHMAQIKAFISEATHGVLSPDDKSMYRTLRRLAAADIITYATRPAKGGPDHKVYSLTHEGTQILAHFLERNITSVFYNPTIMQLIQKG